MSEARDRIVRAVMRSTDEASPDGWTDAEHALDAVLSCPDDLLAVLVEAGVLEELEPEKDQRRKWRQVPQGWKEDR